MFRNALGISTVKNLFRPFRTIRTSANRSKKDEPCEDPCVDKFQKNVLKEVPDQQHLFKNPRFMSYLVPKMIFYYIALPIILTLSLFNYVYYEKKKRPPFVKYSYLRYRVKPFPWGDGNHTFFHNPRTNALPDGYETEEEED